MPKSPKFPRYFLSNVEPKDSQVSSIKYNLFFLTTFINSFIFVELPNICTPIIALVFFVIFFLRSDIETFNVNGSISTNFGINPAWIIGHKDVDQHRDGIKHSSPFLSLFFFRGFIKAKVANKFAEDPEFTIKAYFEPINLANSFSNFFVIADMVIFFVKRTSIPFTISSSENESGDSR